MLPVFSDRRTDWSSHPHATRDSLHEHDMWATEGLTHRYPTKVLAELLPTCPQYCGHCTRMDLVGNSTAVIDKLKFVGKPNDRLGDMLDYLRRNPGVRDVVVSGGDVANMPWPRLEAFLTSLLEIENIRDIRLATKALMGLPQHWLQPDVVEGMTRIGTMSRERGVSIAIHTHVNHANSVTPLVAEATRTMLDTGIRDVRNQGVILNGVNADPHALLDLCFALLDGAQIMPYYFYMCDMIPYSEHWRVSVADAQRLQHAIMGYLPGFATPRIVCDVPYVGKRWIHQLALLRHRARHQLLDQELPHLDRGLRPRGADPDLRVLRPDPHASRGRAAVVGRARPARRVGAQGRRGRRGVPAYGGAPGPLSGHRAAPTGRPRLAAWERHVAECCWPGSACSRPGARPRSPMTRLRRQRSARRRPPAPPRHPRRARRRPPSRCRTSPRGDPARVSSSRPASAPPYDGWRARATAATPRCR